MMSNPGVAAKMFEALTNARVNIHMISTSEVRITVLINESDVERDQCSSRDLDWEALIKAKPTGAGGFPFSLLQQFFQ